MTTVAKSEGFVEVPGGRVWYESAGEGPAILLVHGGPGASSDYLEPLMVLADEGYRVVRYDQLGSRRSDKPDDTSLWQVERFVEELDTVQRTLGLTPFTLIGQSWGGFLAVEYALHHQDQLHSMVVYSGAASTAQCVAGMDALRTGLPEDVQQTMRDYEASGKTSDPIYLAAIDELYRRHLCRVSPMPAPMLESMAHIALPVYNTMWGPNEFTCTGNLMEFDRIDRLSEITVPTLVVCGRYDEVSPECSETIHRGIAGSEMVVFEESSHSSHFEEPDRFWAVLRSFLSRTETNRAP